MIQIRIEVDSDHLIRLLLVKGHSLRAPKGQDIVCSAVSALTWSWARVLEASSLGWSSGTLTPGDLELKINLVPEDEKSWYWGACRVLLQGLQDLALDYPDQITLVAVPVGG